MNPDEFRELVWAEGRRLYRDMPWRDEPTLYHVLVSELMLQQTQVPRVLVKFDEFMRAFPDVDALAAASLADVLRVWQGLGYNRRAKYLHECAKRIVVDGEPMTIDRLAALPGIGRNTAAAIMNYVYEMPTAYVETNIRTVYFHHFFAGNTDVTDKELLRVVDVTFDRERPREWCWALMDYGSHLKSLGHGKLDMSRHYRKQSPLEGSVRQVRGQIIRALARGNMTRAELEAALAADERFGPALEGLLRDGLVATEHDDLHLTK